MITITITIMLSLLGFWLGVLTTSASVTDQALPPEYALLAAGFVLVIIGMVLAVVAIATRRGRVTGIIGLVVGLLSYPLFATAGLLGYLTTQ
ncbi:hypothetical protein [Microlunatus speluncae]|uniref:hypothetical protein n=1 Tax=Microlunatus speluncae TaxID=2594267 RepID=UPI0012667A34|nr:hypothetical protein [Microlunatus speluncae]